MEGRSIASTWIIGQPESEAAVEHVVQAIARSVQRHLA
jgi:hypothetical protein